MDHFGRKFALVFLSIPCILGWLSVGSAGFLAGQISNDAAINIIYCGRMLKGFGVGIVAGASRIYTSEVKTICISCQKLGNFSLRSYKMIKT